MKQLAKTMMIVLAGAFLCTSLSGCLGKARKKKERKAQAEANKIANDYQRKLRESGNKLKDL